MVKENVLIYHIQSCSEDFKVSKSIDRNLLQNNLNENVNLVQCDETSFDNLDFCFKIIDKSDIVVVSDYSYIVSEFLSKLCEYALKKNIPLYAIRNNNIFKFRIVSKVFSFGEGSSTIRSLITKKSGAKKTLF